MSWHHNGSESVGTSKLLDHHGEAASANGHGHWSDRGASESQPDDGVSKHAAQHDIELRSVSSSRGSPNVSKAREIKTEQTMEVARNLERRFTALWLAAVFAVFTILTGIITYVLCYKPIQFSRYYDQSGKYIPSQYSNNDGRRRFPQVSLHVLSNLSIPVTSAICARAVVTLSECRTCEQFASQYSIMRHAGRASNLHPCGASKS